MGSAVNMMFHVPNSVTSLQSHVPIDMAVTVAREMHIADNT